MEILVGRAVASIARMVAQLLAGASRMGSGGFVDDEEWDRLAVDGGWDGGSDTFERDAFEGIDDAWDPTAEVTAVTGCPVVSDQDFTLVESEPPAPPPIRSEIRALGTHRTIVPPP